MFRGLRVPKASTTLALQTYMYACRKYVMFCLEKGYTKNDSFFFYISRDDLYDLLNQEKLQKRFSEEEINLLII